MCGIVGVVSRGAVNQDIYDALTMLQHRGQDAAGMVTSDGHRCYLRKDNGLVRNVFQDHHMEQLKGHIGLGQCRYPTAGTASSAESQPLYVNSPYGIALAHNGNLTNAKELEKDLFLEDLRHINTSSDSEVLLNVLANELNMLHALDPSPTEMFKAVGAVHQRCKGAYAVVAMVIGSGILGFRDPYGIRPLVYGSREVESGTEYMIASESVALDILGFTRIADVAPGEAIFISNDGDVFKQQCAARTQLVPCIFEHVYFARPDSVIDGISVYHARLNQGDILAKRILEQWPEHDIDAVIPVPDSGRIAALQMADVLDVPYREGFVKNRYVGRTFIMPGQALREKSVRRKLNAIEHEFSGKNILLVDDSIVRGTTSAQIIEMARDVGAKKVYFASAAPPVRHPNVYGIDMPAVTEFIANGKTIEEINSIIGSDRLFYQTLEDLIEATSIGENPPTRFDTSCFNGEYITGDIDEAYLERLFISRNDMAKVQSSEDDEIVDMHNDTAD